MTFELDLLKMILKEQQRTNELLAQLLAHKKPDNKPVVSAARKTRTTRRAKAK